MPQRTATIDSYPLIMPQPRPVPPPLDPPMLPFAAAGTLVWAVVGLVLLAVDAPVRWQRMCLAGFLLGLLGVALMALRDHRRRRRATHR